MLVLLYAMYGEETITRPVAKLYTREELDRYCEAHREISTIDKELDLEILKNQIILEEEIRNRRDQYNR